MATNQSRLVRQVLKKNLVPLFEEEGFLGKFPEFQRREKGELHLLSVTFDKNGGGFFLEFVKHPAGDLKTDWGDVVPERELTVAHAPFDSRARLQKRVHPNSLSEDWFRFEDLSEREVEALAQHVVRLFPQVNDWLREKRVGQNVSTTQT